MGLCGSTRSDAMAMLEADKPWCFYKKLQFEQVREAQLAKTSPHCVTDPLRAVLGFQGAGIWEKRAPLRRCSVG